MGRDSKGDPLMRSVDGQSSGKAAATGDSDDGPSPPSRSMLAVHTVGARTSHSRRAKDHIEYVQVLHVEVKGSYFRGKVSSLVGEAHMLRVYDDTTTSDLYDMCWTISNRYATSKKKNAPFTISVASEDGSKEYDEVPNNSDGLVSFMKEARRSRDKLLTVVLKWPSGSLDAKEFENKVDRTNEVDGDDDEEGANLQSCFRKYMQREQLDDDNMWYCPKCKEHRRAYKKMDIWKLPDVLIIHLKRFLFTQGSYFIHRQKIDDFISFPIEGLDLSKYVHDDQGKSSRYSLFAVSNHMGGLGGGHYTAYGKNCLTEKWYGFNDSSVSQTRSSSVVSDSAYVLFYKRDNLDWSSM